MSYSVPRSSPLVPQDDRGLDAKPRPGQLADLVDRGLRFEHGILAVLDGSKALRKGIAKVFDTKALVQRCTHHKRRNVTGYLPEARRKAVDKRLASIFANANAEAGLADARRLAAQLKPTHPDAAASLLEGLEEMFTVARLGITGALRRSLTNTNCIESMISTVRVVTGRVKTWKDGGMKKRWIATGMIEAQRSFRRVKGHTQMANLVTVIGHAVNPVTPADYAQAVAWATPGSPPHFNNKRDILTPRPRTRRPPARRPTPISPTSRSRSTDQGTDRWVEV